MDDQFNRLRTDWLWSVNWNLSTIWSIFLRLIQWCINGFMIVHIIMLFDYWFRTKNISSSTCFLNTKTFLTWRKFLVKEYKSTSFWSGWLQIWNCIIWIENIFMSRTFLCLENMNLKKWFFCTKSIVEWHDNMNNHETVYASLNQSWITVKIVERF